MLGVFRRDVKKPDPLAPELPGPEYIPALKDGYLEKYFASIYSDSVIVNLGTHGFMAYSTDKNISPSPRPIFSMRSGIYCIYRGQMEMTENRKKVGESVNEIEFLMACYVGVKEKGNKAAFEAMQVLGGDYNYILYDRSVNRQGAMRGAFAVNCWKDMSLYFGLDSEGCCVIADDMTIMEKVCGDSFKLIPKGYGLLIPVLVKSRIEPTEAKSSDGSSSGEASPSGGSGVVVQKGVTIAGNPSGGSSSSAEKLNAGSPADGNNSNTSSTQSNIL